MRAWIVLAFCLMGFSNALLAQVCPYGAYPGRLDEPQICRPPPDDVNDEESGPPAQRLITYWASNYVAVAWHPNASDVWAIWNAQSEEEAKEGALRLCTVAMTKGCVIANVGSNSSISIARASDGTLWSGWGETPKKAKMAVLASCQKQGARCIYEKTFTGKPYRDAAGTMPLVKLEYYAPPFQAPLRNRYGALAWIEATDARWDETIWMSSGHNTQEEAGDAVVAKCEKDSKLKCKVVQSNSNGFIVLYRDDQAALRVSGAQSADDAEKWSREVCKKAKRSCKTLAVFDVRQPGLVTRSFPSAAAK